MCVLSRLKRRYPIQKEIRELSRDRRMLLSEAIELFAKENPTHGSLSDYKKALYKHRVSYQEYMYGYEFWRLREKQRREFISQKEMWCIYRKTIHTNVRKYLIDKVLFLKAFKEFVNRSWIYPRDTVFDSFVHFVSSHSCIAKPLYGDQGKGVFLVKSSDDESYRELFDYCRENNYLLEEIVRSCSEIEEYHPQSLNTIRIVTMSGHGKCRVLGALLRMGTNGSFVDNTHSGGIFAPIDIRTGITMTDGIDLQGGSFVCHPNTGKRIKGFMIPHWEDCLRTCTLASQVIPENYFTGWDLCILPGGQIELIEGNSAPDVDGGLQAPLKIGIRSKIRDYGKELLGFNPISLIPIWSRSYKDI